MALMPRRVKYRKAQRKRLRGKAWRGNAVAFGEYGLQALEHAWLTAQQIEAARVAASRHLATAGRYWVRIFPYKPVSGKPAETRMGKGKGEVEYWAAPVKPGQVLFEIGGVPEDAARETFRLQSGKLPIRVRMIRRKVRT
jgi:large subunit ribosomal protein L16